MHVLNKLFCTFLYFRYDRILISVGVLYYEVQFYAKKARKGARMILLMRCYVTYGSHLILIKSSLSTNEDVHL